MVIAGAMHYSIISQTAMDEARPRPRLRPRGRRLMHNMPPYYYSYMRARPPSIGSAHVSIARPG